MIGRILAVAVAVAAGASAAQAENWRAASAGRGANAYIDVDSIRRDGDMVTFTREIRWAEPRALQDGRLYDRLVGRLEGNCRDMTLRSLHISAKLADQVLVAADVAGAFERASPGSNADVDLRAACGNWPRR